MIITAYAQVTVTIYYSDDMCTIATSEAASTTPGSCTPGDCVAAGNGVYQKTTCQTGSYTPTSGFIGFTSYIAANCDFANLRAGAFGKPDVGTKTGT